MKIGDFVEIRAFPSVVQAADVRLLRENPQSDATRDFVGGYLGFDDRARHATETLLRSLSQPSGGAFFLNGVFGSGKSHLLGCVALLSDGAAHDEFADSHPHLREVLRAFTPRFVVHFSLDEYAAARFSLEEIFWREVAREAESRGFAADEIAFAHDGARGETFAIWEETLTRRGFEGAVICLDELSLFLSGREHRALQGDAAFLQFLAQRARRSQPISSESSTRCALWIVAALQKTVEEIGDLDAYALAQIRDRFVTLPLSLAHLPSLVERRLVAPKNAETLAKFCESTFDETLRALPRLDFGREEWRALYPFHPATIGLLEAIAARFGSRTRSAVLFCQGISLENDAANRVLADALFDFWASEMATFPDLKPLAEVWRAWPEIESEIALDTNEARAMRKLMKTAILFAVAGRVPSVAALTNALLLDAQLPADGNYEYAQILLEKMRAGGAGLSLQRHEGMFADRYFVDADARAGELARRFTFNALHTLPSGDRRIAQYVLRCCRDEILPLASLVSSASSTRNADVMWLHTPRALRLELADETPSPEILANRLAALAGANSSHDLLLFIVPPLTTAGDVSSTRYAANSDSQTLQTAWREAFSRAFELLKQRDESTDWARWRHAVAWWLPRAATNNEWEQAREATAQHQLLNDVQLLDNARGLAVLEHLRAGLREREASLSRLGTRLLREGSFANGGGAHVEAGELALGENWASALEAVANWSLPDVFPRFARVAPRLRVLTPSSADALCLEILRRPNEAPFFAASLERTVRGVAQTLGVAREQNGRWRIVSPAKNRTSSTRNDDAASDLAHEILEFLRVRENQNRQIRESEKSQTLRKNTDFNGNEFPENLLETQPHGTVNRENFNSQPALFSTQKFEKTSGQNANLPVANHGNADAENFDSEENYAASEPQENSNFQNASAEVRGNVDFQSANRENLGGESTNSQIENRENSRCENVTLAMLEIHFSRSAWGVSALQLRIVLCALLRGGEISARDARGRQLAANEIGLPLARSVHTVREGRVLDAAIWAKLREIVVLLSGENLGAISFDEQGRARAILQLWRDETTASTELAQARLHQWQRQIGQSESWSRAAETLTEMAQLLSKFSFDSSSETLAKLAEVSTEETRATVKSWRETVEFLDEFHAPLLSFHSFLAHRELTPPLEMQASRVELLTRFESAFDDGTLLDDANSWRNEYSKNYAEWHQIQHALPRFATFRRLAQSDEMRVLNRLSALTTRDFSFVFELQDALQHEISKMCRHGGTLAHEPVCVACRLVLGKRLRLRDPNELEAMAQNGVEKFREMLRENGAQTTLENDENGAALLEWRDDGDATNLLPLLSADALRGLDEAFRPRRVAPRSWAELVSRTRECRTKRQWREAFSAWLEADETLNDDDEISLCDEVSARD